jgi:hypothetical protein
MTGCSQTARSAKENIRITGQEEEDIISPDKALNTITYLLQQEYLRILPPL